MSISIEKIIQAVKSVKSNKSAGENSASKDENPIAPDSNSTANENPSLELSDDEKKLILILESAGFFTEDFSDKSIGTVCNIAQFIAENLVEIYNRTKDSKSANDVSVCPSCGAIGIAGASFCYSCGAKIETTKVSRRNLPMLRWRNKFFDVTKVPGFEIAITPITQEIWTEIMGFNPSSFRGESNPVEGVSWYDAIYFCNKLSKEIGYEPCYSLFGKTDVKDWGYNPEKDETLLVKPECDFKANGFRLPTVAEWVTAATARDNFLYSGSDSITDVAWFRENSENQTHAVGSKKKNSFGLYDMSGNVYEWCWDELDTERYFCGGSWKSQGESCALNCLRTSDPGERLRLFGLRVVRSV